MSTNPTQAITANRLSDGFVVYLTAQDQWSERIEDCQTAADQGTAETLFARARQHADGGHVVGPYLFKVACENGRAVPLGRREFIRTTGPSVGTDLNLR